MNQSFTQDVDPILYLPCSTPEFERRLWEAVLEAPGRDWDETEKEYLRRNDGIRETLADWAEFMKFSHCWSDANVKFIRPYLIDAADELDSPSSANPTTKNNR